MNAMRSEFGIRELLKNGKQCSDETLDEISSEPVTNEIKINAQILNGRRYKDLFKAKKANAAGQVFGEKKKQGKRDDSVTEDICPMEDEITAENLPPSSEGQSTCRLVSLRTEEACSSDCVNPVRDDDLRDALSGNLTSDQDQFHSSACHLVTEIGKEHKRCTHCGHGGDILSCAGQGCDRSFHPCCVDPPFTYFPPCVWHCIWCVIKKMKLGVYSVSEGIESILDARGESHDEETKKQYLVKYKGLAHVHSCWIEKKKLLQKAPAVFSRYKKHKRISRWNKKWTEPKRLLAKRLLILPQQSNSDFHENDQYCRYEWLVKWTGLDYDQATWELEDAPFLKTPEGTNLINEFSTRHEVKEEANHAEERKGQKTSFHELSELLCGGPDHLVYVNKLLERWHKDQNALIIDAQDERIMVVVLFLLSLLKEMKGPFLILTSSTSLPLWEAEFQRLAKSIHNVVVYEGNADNRNIIRNLEFYNEGGCIMFQGLLSPSNAVADDIEYLKPIKWEVVVVDGFLRPTMSVHTEKMKMLAANMRLLLVRSQFKDWCTNYLRALSLLDPDYEWINDDVLGDDADIDTSELKEKLVEFVAYERQREAVKLTEFWVPVMLSDVQTEQYCATLFSNSTSLCAYSRGDPTFSLHDVLKTTRKCCDHPYLVDRSLRNSVLRGKPLPDHFDVEIQMSGKLQLLNEILPEIKRRGLRVVILFQAIECSGKISIGDILDDFLHQKFGKISYSRFDGGISRSKKRASFDVFNNKENGNFVCLMETRACCLPSTKLSSVDTIIIFNSDWDPANDLKALQKITIASQFEQLKIFRLYSSYTVEEKALILAKEGVTLDGNIKNIKQSSCQKLLAWGASCLFGRLDGSNELNSASSSSLMNSLEQTISEGVIQELLALLPCTSVENGSTFCSSTKKESNNVLSVQLSEGTYQGNNLYLVGELKTQPENHVSVVRDFMDKPPRFFWRNLLQGRKPRWKYMCSPSQKNKRKVKFIGSLLEETKGEARDVKKSRTDADNICKRTPKSRLIMERGLHGSSDKKKLAGNCIRRYKQGRKVAKNVPLERGKEAAEPFRGQVMEVDKAANLCTVGRLTDDVVPGVQPVRTPFERSEPDAERESMNLDFSNNHSSEVSSGRLQVPQSACLVSLQKEMDSIQEVKEQTIQLHEEVKLQLESEREKEIREVNKKYDLLIQNAEAVMEEKKSALESCYQITYKQKLLAEAMILKQDVLPASDSQGRMEVNLSTFMKEIYQFYSTLPTPISEHSPLGRNPNPPATVESSWSAARECGTCHPTTPEGQSVEPRTVIRSPATSGEVVNNYTPAGQRMPVPASFLRAEISSSNGPMPTPSSQTSSELQQQPGAGDTDEHDQFSTSLAMTETPAGTKHTLLISNSWRPPHMAGSLSSVKFHSGRKTRGPAPHLRNTLPFPVISDSTSRPC